MKKATIFVLLMYAVAACSSVAPIDRAAMCVGGETAGWTVVSEPADRADLFREIVAKTPVFTNPIQSPLETWIRRDDGAVLVCHSDGPPEYAQLGSWWLFDVKQAPVPQLMESDGWIIVAHERR